MCPSPRPPSIQASEKLAQGRRGVKAGENPLASNVMKLKTLLESMKVSSKTVSYSGGTKQDGEELNSSHAMPSGDLQTADHPSMVDLTIAGQSGTLHL